MRRHTKRLAAAAALALLAIWTAFRVLLGRSPLPTYRPSFSLKSKLQVVAARTTSIPATTAMTTRAPATAPAESKSDCWMLLAMPSAPRDGGRDYLNATLDALLCQLAAAPPTPGRVCVAVYGELADLKEEARLEREALAAEKAKNAKPKPPPEFYETPSRDGARLLLDPVVDRLLRGEQQDATARRARGCP